MQNEQKIRLLIAEDDRTSRAMLCTVVSSWGFTPVPAADGREALRLLQEPPAPQLALIDWNIPAPGGPELCRLVRLFFGAGLPYLIFLTARTEKKDIVAGLEAGADDYLTKPYDPEELQARLRVGRRMINLYTALVTTRDKLAHEASHDHLTGCLNRRAILEELARRLAAARAPATPPGVAMFDLDHFKKVNDRHGHPGGDKALRAFVARVGRHLRPGELLGRMGGEEFLLIIPGRSPAGQAALCEEIRQALAGRPLALPGGIQRLTVSIGLAIAAGGEKDIYRLLGAADRALYRAKRLGRNRLVCASGAAGGPAAR